MYRNPDGELVYSPSDLAEFAESRFASWMSRYALDHPEVKPEEDASNEVFKKHGTRHEDAVLARFRGELGLDVAEIESGSGHAAAEEATRSAIAAGRDVVYQARLTLAPFAGYADFLVHPRVAARASGLPGHAGTVADAGTPYEVWDAKLARSVKPKHLIQLCAYADMIEALEGVRPEHLVVVLGTKECARLRNEDYFYYYRSVRDAFLEAMEAYDEGERPLPEYGAKHGDWQATAEALLEECDHPSRVARITRVQCRKLEKAGIETLAQLADCGAVRVPRLAPATLSRLSEQARLQRDSVGLEKPLYRVLDPNEVQLGKGLSNLPPASPGDVFFDLEGYPLADGGLEYLWGAATHGSDGAPVYRAFWAHDASAEQRAFETFIDWLVERRAAYPDLHVYHYAPYEVSAIRRIAGRSGSREAEVHALLVEHVFVDLYQIVRHALLVGEPSYGIKNIEKLYREARGGEVTSGLASMVEYENWLDSEEPGDPAGSPLLESIRAYNEDDCVSTLELEAWLRGHQRERSISYEPPRQAPIDVKRLEEIRKRQAAQRELMEKLRADLPPEPPSAGPDRETWRIGMLLMDLVGFHGREARPVYWDLFERAGMTESERADQPECLAGLERTARDPFPIKSSRGYEYTFDLEQDTRIKVGDACRLAEDWTFEVNVEEIDSAKGRAVLRLTDDRIAKSRFETMPDRLCLIRFSHRTTGVMEDSIAATAERWLERHELPSALEGYLHRSAPRVKGSAGGPLRNPGEPLGKALDRLAAGLEGSTLCVQGPPGSGKTTHGAGAIVSLADAKKCTIGITSNSHKAIGNLMHACGEEARRRGVALRLVKVGSNTGDQRVDGEPDAIGCESKDAAAMLHPGTVIGGTAWLFSRSELAERLDHLFVDEAGQVSLANLVAMSHCARNLVLLGDPAQLAQPLRGVHPRESGTSALEYAMRPGQTVISAEQGLFLEDTHRLHPSLCEFVSGAFYEGKLNAAAGNHRRELFLEKEGEETTCASAASSGLFFVPVHHEGNSQASPEEVAEVSRLFTALLGRRFRDRTRAGESERALGLKDILVVAPYNLHVALLQAALPKKARVGTVDKFQGQQAPVVIVSMAASSGREAPRGLQFLLDPHRLNVAVSRAQCLALVVGSPGIIEGSNTSVRVTELMNRFCRMVQNNWA